MSNYTTSISMAYNNRFIMKRNANNCSKNNITRRHKLHNNSIKQKMISPLLILSLQLLSLFTLTNAQTTNPKECSCSPQTFVFRLALSASCPALPPPFPPNDTFGAGVKDYTCSIGLEPIPSGASQEVTSEDGVPLVDEGEEDTDSATRRKRKLENLGDLYDYFSEEEIALATQQQRDEVIAATKNGKVTADMKSLFPEYFDNIDSITDEIFSMYQLEEVPIDELEWSSSSFSSSGAVIPDPAQSSVDVVPVSIYSIQFLEVDSKFNVINQDSSYVRGIDFENGAVFNYTSILSKPLAQTMGVVPGGMNMVLRGVTAAGEPVRNVFTITYTNDCGIQTFEEGDAIGWVVFENFVPATVEMCGRKATPPPTPGEPNTPRPSPPSHDGGGGGYWSGSSKGSKTKSGKGSKSSKSSKGGKVSKSYFKSTEDGSSWMGPRSSPDYRTQSEPVRRRRRRGLNLAPRTEKYDFTNDEDNKLERRSLGR